ncbi:hypothetical protein [Sphaerisporangium dianthi]|uniref:Uncharacterized protein n=1 Tax=Sphaerisporangium dianthi TaxID=1436120 RepID=A0ABV9CNI7_9ACTN
MTDDLLNDLWLGHIPDVAVNTLTISANRVTIHATTTTGGAAYPSCGTASARVHSSYVRRLDDSLEVLDLVDLTDHEAAVGEHILESDRDGASDTRRFISCRSP